MRIRETIYTSVALYNTISLTILNIMDFIKMHARKDCMLDYAVLLFMQISPRHTDNTHGFLVASCMGPELPRPVSYS